MEFINIYIKVQLFCHQVFCTSPLYFSGWVCIPASNSVMFWGWLYFQPAGLSLCFTGGTTGCKWNITEGCLESLPFIALKLKCMCQELPFPLI